MIRSLKDSILQLVSSKCMPTLLYGLQAGCLNKSTINSLDIVVNRILRNLFKTNDISIVKHGQCEFNFNLTFQVIFSYIL